MTTHTPSPTPELHTVLTTSASVLAVFSYFTGWIYLYFYLRHFGISLWSLDIPFHFFFVYAYSVGMLTLVILGVLMVGVVVSLLGSAFSVRVRMIGLVFLGSLALPTLYYFAKRVALERAEQARSGTVLPDVEVVLVEAAEKTIDEGFRKANQNGELQLLLETKEQIFVLHQLVGRETALPIGHVFTLRREDLALVKVEVQ